MDQTVLLQWNCKSLQTKKQDLISLINLHKPVVIAISETWLRPGSRFRVPGFFCLRDDRDDGYAGSAIFIRHNLPFTSIPIPSHSNQINAVGLKYILSFSVYPTSSSFSHPRTPNYHICSSKSYCDYG